MNALARRLSVPLFMLMIAAPVASAQQSQPAFSQAELDQMLAPIALYPDALLSQVLMASTYPLEVVEAARWSKENPGLDGARAVEAVQDKGWDASVKALVAFPQVLARMDEELEWTRRLGEAFLLQQSQVTASIQALRERAYALGQLDSLSYLHAYREGGAIVIEPADPRVVYVPYYRPRLVYGGWWWPAYAPVYWGPPAHFHLHAGFFWGRGILVSTAFFFSTFDWRHRHVAVHFHKHLHKHHFKRPFHKHRFKAGKHHHRTLAGFRKWKHDPRHRRGVSFHNPGLSRQFTRSHPSGAVGHRAAGAQRGWVGHRGFHSPRRDVSRGRTGRSHGVAGMHDRRAGGAGTGHRHSSSGWNTNRGASRGSHAFDRSATHRGSAGNWSRATRGGSGRGRTMGHSGAARQSAGSFGHRSGFAR